jgi:membrane protease YdiL (CAAX protease family)
VAVILLVGDYPLAPAAALLVLLWARLSHTSWSELGFSRPKSWTLTIVGGVLFGIAFKLAMKALVMPLLGADPVNQTFHYLAGNRAELPAAIYAVVVGGGFGEETVFRGFLFERLGKLLGTTRRAKMLTVAITTVLFALGHYTLQGFPAVEQALFTGLAFGTIVAVTGRIWTAMIAHAVFDLTALALIYWNWESVVAHWVFK